MVSGQIVAIPTETFFGLACDPRHREAVETLLRLKNRPEEQGISLVIDSFDRVETWIAEESNALAMARRALCAQWWPGALTIIIAVRAEVLAEAFHPGIYGPDQSLAIRLSPIGEIQQLAAAVGGGVTAPSANPRGQQPARSEQELKKYFPDLPILASSSPDLGKYDTGSTFIDVRQLPFKLVREGAVRRQNLTCWLQAE